MKRVICLIFILLLCCASFAGCNGKGFEGEQTEKEPAASPPAYIEPTPSSGIVAVTMNKVEAKTLTLSYAGKQLQKKVIAGSTLDGYMASRIIGDKAIIGWSESSNGGGYTSKIEEDMTLYAVFGDYVRYTHTKTQENSYTISVRSKQQEKVFFIDFNDIKAIDAQAKLENPNGGANGNDTPELSKKFVLSVENDIDFIYIKGVPDHDIDLSITTFIRQKPLYITLDNVSIASSAGKAAFDLTNVVGAVSVIEVIGSSELSCKNNAFGILANEGSLSMTGDGASIMTVVGGNHNGQYAGTAINAEKLLINNVTLNARGGTNRNGQGGISILSKNELSLLQSSVTAIGGDGKTGGASLSYAKDAVMNLVPNSFVFNGIGGQGESDGQDGKDFQFSYLGYSD